MQCAERAFDLRSEVCHLDNQGLVCPGPPNAASDPVRSSRGQTQQEAIRVAYSRHMGREPPMLTKNVPVVQANCIELENGGGNTFEDLEEWGDDDEFECFTGDVCESGTYHYVDAVRREGTKDAALDRGKFAKPIGILKKRSDNESKLGKVNARVSNQEKWDRLSRPESDQENLVAVSSDATRMEVETQLAAGQSIPTTALGAKGKTKAAPRGVDARELAHLREKLLGTRIEGFTFGDFVSMDKSSSRKLLYGTELLQILERDQEGPEPLEFKVSSIDLHRQGGLRMTVPTPKIPVEIESQVVAKLKALLDCGAEISVITRKVQEEIGLPMRRFKREVSLIGHNNGKNPLIGICPSVKIRVGPAVVEQHLYVCEAGSHALILGQPFIEHGRVRIGWLNGIQTAWVTGDDDEEVVIPLRERSA